jgi:hypothetical protein
VFISSLHPVCLSCVTCSLCTIQAVSKILSCPRVYYYRVPAYARTLQLQPRIPLEACLRVMVPCYRNVWRFCDGLRPKKGVLFLLYYSSFLDSFLLYFVFFCSAYVLFCFVSFLCFHLSSVLTFLSFRFTFLLACCFLSVGLRSCFIGPRRSIVW